LLLQAGLLLALISRPAEADVLTQPAPATNAVAPLTPGVDDGIIARATARMLEDYQYLHLPFDETVSSNLLEHFMGDLLDPQHLHFLQTDQREFAHYGSMLGEMTLRYGDTTPADEIYNRFLERAIQHTAYVKQLLGTETFEFTNDERVLVNRHKAPYPKDLAEAKQIWRDRLRLEYLQELLNAENPDKTNAPAKLTPTNAAVASTAGLTNGTSLAATNAAAAPRTREQIRADIVKTLTKRYDRILKMYEERDAEDVLEFYLTTLAHVYDPHSDYFGKSQSEDFAMTMNLSLFGIGAMLTTDDDGYCKIKEVKPGPAFKTGKVKADDRIVAVAQGTNEPVDVVNMPLNKVVQLIRGPKGTEVRLTLIPAGADSSVRKVVSIVRDEIKLEDQAAKAKIIDLPDGQGGKLRLGVIDLPSFYATFSAGGQGESTPRSCTADVTKLLVKLAEEKVAGVILDLRRNGGGSLEEAIRLTGLFIKSGPVVQVRDPLGRVLVKSDDDPAELYDGPLFVLTSRFSASASEIVAGALQDYGRALIIGDSSTHGKGTVQTLQPLAPLLRGRLFTTNSPGELKVTIQKFYRPSGSSTQLKGVVPDIVLPSVDNVADIGETALDNPLPWDTITSSDFDHMNRVAPYLDALRKRSAQRVATNKDFAYIREDMEQFKKAQDDKTVSANEAARLKEMREDTARKKARDAERAARKEPQPAVYEISLAQADLPGLPPPTNSVAQAGLPVHPAADAAPGAAEEDKAPEVDANLVEAEHVMADYISLSAKGSLAATRP
jgi:carboxyl-terminal processing protease